jgi:hypothetical protein
MHLVEQEQTQNFANAGNRLEPVEGLGIVLLCCPEDRQLDVAQQPIIVVNQRKIDFDAFLYRGIREPLGDSLAVGFLRNLFADLGQVILAVGILDMGEQLGACAREMQAPPQEITGRTHLRRIDIRLGQHAATQQPGNFLGVDLIVFRLATMDGFHIQSVPQDKRQPFLRTQGGEPVPRKDTFDGDDHIVPIGCDGLEQGVGTG